MSFPPTMHVNSVSRFWQSWADKALAQPTSMLNHLLTQEPWATKQLQGHAGKVACIDFRLFSLRAKITAHGFVESVSNDVKADVTIHINPADIPLIIQDKERAISYVKLEGDAELAQTLSELGKNLRWDTEQQLSDWFGDIAGRRIANTGKSVLTHLQNNAQKLQENLAEYFLEENPMLVRPARVTEFAQEVVRTRDDVERLQKRIEKYEKALHGS
jgi:ubiquinone biosynthesis protein UbiJ